MDSETFTRRIRLYRLEQKDKFEFSIIAVEGMRKLKQQKKFCDFVIPGEGVYAHKCYLASVSPFFRDMFEDRREITGMDFKYLKLCIDYLYGDVNYIDYNEIGKLFKVARKLLLHDMIHDAARDCGNKMAAIDSADGQVETLFTLLLTSESLNSLQLTHVYEERVGNLFSKISQTPAFLSMEEADFAKMFMMKGIKATEVAKLDALLRWTAENDPQHKVYFDLFRAINPAKIPYTLRDSFIHLALSRQNEEIAQKVKLAYVDKLLAFHQERMTAIFDPTLPKAWCTWRKIPSNISQMCGSIVHVGNTIYVLMVNCQVFSLRYMDETGIWVRKSDMTRDHGQCPPAVVVSEKIYVVAGDEHKMSREIDRFDPDINFWQHIGEKSQATRGSTVVAHGNYIYSIGGVAGFDQRRLLKNLESYHVDSKTWQTLKPMKKGRFSAAAVVYRNKIYVAGGRGLVKDCKAGVGYIDGSTLRSVEYYDMDRMEWTTVSSMGFTNVLQVAFVMNCEIYVFGCDVERLVFMKYRVEDDQWDYVDAPGMYQEPGEDAQQTERGRSSTSGHKAETKRAKQHPNLQNIVVKAAVVAPFPPP